MIELHRPQRGRFFVNADLIEHLEATPDTVLTLTTGAKYMVSEPVDEVVARVLAYHRAVHAPAVQELSHGSR